MTSFTMSGDPKRLNIRGTSVPLKSPYLNGKGKCKMWRKKDLDRLGFKHLGSFLLKKVKERGKDTEKEKLCFKWNNVEDVEGKYKIVPENEKGNAEGDPLITRKTPDITATIDTYCRRNKESKTKKKIKKILAGKNDKKVVKLYFLSNNVAVENDFKCLGKFF